MAEPLERSEPSAVDLESRDELSGFARYAFADPLAQLDPSLPLVSRQVLVKLRAPRSRGQAPERIPDAPGIVSTEALVPLAPASASVPALETAFAEAPTQSATDFIALELQDESGAALAGIAYSITLPDGSVREGSLGADGSVRLEGIASGQCTVRFPDLGRAASREELAA